MIRFLALILTIFCLSLPASAQSPMVSDEIVAALDDHLVAIDTGFSGSKVLLFGATEGEGDVVVIVRGPSNREVVRRKERVMGVWANKEKVAFSDTPVFYNIATSGNLEELVPASTRQRLELGPDNLNTYLAPEYKNIGDKKKEEFWQALLRAKKRDGLYAESATPVKFLGKRLFRADIEFPANIPVGTYLVYVYLVKDKDVVSTQITPLFVSKIGVEAGIYDFAHRHSLAYGVIAVVIALLSGWIASVAFRKK
ncbi:TIGR02186 family protein [Terasakiella sp. A23]|uniref:TIGR02186 family protein n=1 Tax=Terasakiella sp. FCG-A23 TaxID=3080561 RepID=UPI00295559E0|nr:TIGR02186 family protein [Terasakiella sp. A23]MDV7340417.1 TIGR02186 family protein [Terasakiella sp. A23]